MCYEDIIGRAIGFVKRKTVMGALQNGVVFSHFLPTQVGRFSPATVGAI
jgi:hypothetical protein